MVPSALIWDVDGTLTDSTALIAEALDHIYLRFYHQETTFDERRALIGTPLKKQIRIFGEPEQFGTTEEEVFEAFIGCYEAGKHRERILDDVIAVLTAGSNLGIPTGLVTSKNREELANTLPRLGIEHAIGIAVTADDVAHPKPAPDGILLALSTLGIRAEHAHSACYIGDTTHDMRAARDAGVRLIGVAWGAAGKDRLAAENPEFIADTPEELHQYLLGAKLQDA
jgi:HAD superfamily hydrolase (TIGR01549 family)